MFDQLVHMGGVKRLVQIMQDRSLQSTRYHGIPSVKCPLDFWVYQEIVWETRPDSIIEIGVHRGGTLLALAHLCDNIGHGRVVGCDIHTGLVDDRVRSHPRVTLVTGDACEMVGAVMDAAGGKKMVIEDSAHTFENTRAVLDAYAPYVAEGQYLIVEDGICWNGLDHGPRPGPREAVRAWLKDNPEWESDLQRQPFGLTWNPDGFLRRRKAA